MNPFNPFGLDGSAFLVYYAVIGAVIVGALVLFQRLREDNELPPVHLTDPNLIACLRDGDDEVLQLAVLTLLEERLLEADDGWLSPTDREPVRPVTPLEQALLAHLTPGPGRAEGALSEPSVRVELRRLHDTLVERGLIPSHKQQEARGIGLLVGVVLLWLSAAVNIGSPNTTSAIFLLIVLAGVFTAAAAYLPFQRRTAAGDRALADLQELCVDQRTAFLEAEPGGLAPKLLVAVYGLAVLPGLDWDFLQKLFPGVKAPDEGKAGCGGCGGGSCGGGSCGGDSGCGGGCGGCGGCGCGG